MFMPKMPAISEAGSSSAETTVSTFITSLVRCAVRVMYRSNAPTMSLPGALCGLHRLLDALAQQSEVAGRVAARDDVGACVREGAVDVAVRTEAAAQIAHPAAAGDELVERPIAQLVAQDVLLDAVGGALLALHGQEELVELPLEQRGEEVGRVQLPQGAVRVDVLVERVEELDLRLVRGHQPAFSDDAGEGSELGVVLLRRKRGDGEREGAAALPDRQAMPPRSNSPSSISTRVRSCSIAALEDRSTSTHRS